MAFENKNLFVIAYANGFTWWHYKADEPIENVLTDGYFNPINNLLSEGDVINISHGTDLYIRCLYKDGDTWKLKNTK